VSKLYKVAIENNNFNEDEDVGDIISILEEHDILHSNYDLHADISSGVEVLTKMENDFHNQINLSFESYQNNSVALETLIESLKEFWDKIVAFIKSIIEKIVQFFQAHFGLLSRRKKQILKLIDEYNELEAGLTKHEATKDTITITDYEWLYLDSKPCDSGTKLLDGIKDLIKATNYIFGDYLSTVISRGEVIESAINHIKNNNSSDIYEKFIKDFLYKGVEQFQFPLLNNKTFDLTKPPINENASFKDKVKVLSIIKVDITDTIEIPKNKSVVFENIQVSEAKGILSELLTLIEVFESFNKTRLKEVLKVGDRIRDDSDTLMKRIESMFKEDPDNREQITSVRALVGLNPAYVRWVKTPTTELVHVGTECIFHTCSLLEKNIAKYNKRKSLNILSIIGAM